MTPLSLVFTYLQWGPEPSPCGPSGCEAQPIAWQYSTRHTSSTPMFFSFAMLLGLPTDWPGRSTLILVEATVLHLLWAQIWQRAVPTPPLPPWMKTHSFGWGFNFKYALHINDLLPTHTNRQWSRRYQWQLPPASWCSQEDGTTKIRAKIQHHTWFSLKRASVA